MKKIYFILTIVCVVFASCSKDDTPTNGPPNNDVLLPLKIGNQWIMRITFIDSTHLSPVYDTMTVTKDTLIENERWYYLDRFGSYWTNKSDGVWSRNNKDSELNWKYPATAGEKYSIGVDNTVQVFYQNVSVPAGNYWCYEYKYLRLDFSWFLSPNLGFVKTSDHYIAFSDRLGVYLIREELVKVVLN